MAALKLLVFQQFFSAKLKSPFNHQPKGD